MRRRSFLTGGLSLLGSSILAGCRPSSRTGVQVYFLKNTFPTQLLKQFQQQLPANERVQWTVKPQLQDLFAQLEQWGEQPLNSLATAPLVSLGDYWLVSAQQQKLIQPLDPAQLRHWKQLPERWQQLVQRGSLPTPAQPPRTEIKQEVWGAPYRWGMTVIAYRKDKFEQLGWLPADWQDLWRSPLRHRLSLLDHPREVIGLTLKKLGYSYNTNAPAKIADLERELAQLNRQALFYSSDTYLQPLMLGDTWAAVGWSTDVLPLMRRNDKIGVIVPRSGTALWADVWVRPALEIPPPAVALQNRWMDYWWQPAIANALSQFSDALSPSLTDLQPNGPAKKLLLPDQPLFDRSEFLLPLSKTAIEEFGTLWTQMRQSSSPT